MGFFQRLGNDIFVHPFGIGNAPSPQPARTPAPQQSQRPVIQTPQQGMQRMQGPAPRPIGPPPMNLFQHIGNTFHNDVVQPFQRDVVAPVQRDVVKPVTNAVQAIPRIPANVDNMANRSAVGRGLQSVGLGALQAGTEFAQTMAGLGDALNHKLGNYQGNSPVTKGINNLAQNIDATAKANHSNPLLYHGTQVGLNVASLGLGGGAKTLASGIPKVGGLIKGAETLNDASKAAVAARTANLAEKGLPGRVAAKTIQNIASPGYQAANAAYTGMQTGQQIAKGQKVTPGSVAQNLTIGGVGFPVVGAVGHEATAPIVNKAVSQLKAANIIRPSSLTNQEVAHLSNFRQQAGSGSMMSQDTYDKGVAAANKAGVNYNDGKAVDNLLGAHQTYATHVQQRVQALQTAHDKALQFAQVHPIGLTSGAVDKNGNKLGLDGKPLNATKPPAENVGAKTATKAKAVVKPANVTLPNGNKLSRNANVTVQNSDQISPLVKTLVAQGQSQYTPFTIEAGQKVAQKFAQDLNAVGHIQAKLNSPLGHINHQDVLNTHAVVDKLKGSGKPEDSMLAANMLTQLSEHHSAAGQTNAAAAALSSRSPQGLVQQGRTQIMNGGKGGRVQSITPELQSKLDAVEKKMQTAHDAVTKAEAAHEAAVKAGDAAYANGTYKVGQLNHTHAALEAADSAKLQAHEDLAKLVQQNIHHSAGSKAFALWRTGLLTGPRTLAKVAVSHTGMGALEQAKQVPATALDKLASGAHYLATGKAQYSTAFAPHRGIGDLAKGGKASWHLLKTGHDTAGTGGFEGTLAGKLTHTAPVFKGNVGKILNPYMEKVGQAHASMPKPFYTYANKNSMYKQAIAAAKTAGIKGDQKAAFIDKFIHQTNNASTAEAKLDGQIAAFQQGSASGRVASALQHVPGGKVIMPFAHIASTILADAAHYSPASVGIAGHAVIKAIRSGEGWTPTVQKHFVEELGRGITGTGIGVIGYELAKHGLITGGYPTDPAERKIWQAQGKQANSILIGGKWRQTSTLEPAGTLLAAGQSAYEAGQTNGKGKSQLGPSVTGALQDMTSQSYLSGLTGLSDAIAHPTQYGAKFVKQQAGSVVPIAVSTVASATDPLQRNTSGVVDSFKSKLPGLRETLTPSQNMYGQNLQRQGGVVTGLLDPTRPTNAVNDPTTNELQRLQTSTGSTSTPTEVKSINATDQNGKKIAVPLNTGQQHGYNANAGPQVKQAYQQIMSNPNYNQLTDANKVSALNSAKDNAQSIPKANAAKAVNPNATVKLTNSQANGVQTDYVQNKLNEQSGGSAGTPINAKLDSTSRATLNKYNGMNATDRKKAAYSQNAFDYNYAVAKYANDKANGSLSKAEDITARAAIDKAKVGKDYSKDVRDIYDRTKSQIADFITTDPNGKAFADQLSAYDKALYAAGIISKPKFKNGFGDTTASAGTKAKSGGGGSGKSTALPSPISYKNTAPKTSLGKYKLAKTSVGGGTGKVRLASYKTATPKMGKVRLPGASKTVKLASAPKLPKQPKPTNVKRVKRGVYI